MYNAPIIYSDTGSEFINEASPDTIFVLDNFEGSVFRILHKARCRILGPPAVIHCVQANEPLPLNSRPLFCQHMDQLVICFTGFKAKEDLSRLADLVHHMGGSLRKDFSCRVTHLVANCTSGEKYRVAVSMGAPVMTEEWVFKVWDHRDQPEIKATDEHLVGDVMLHKLSPFSFSVLSFQGFSREEARHMEEVTIENGGSCVEVGAPSCTHLVVDEHAISSRAQLPSDLHPRLHIVKAEWFWASIQMDACADETMYTMDFVVETPTQNAATKSTPKTLSGSKSRKRKRLRENIAQLASEGEIDTPMYKRRSSEVARMSFSASFLDATADTSNTPVLSDVKLTPRQQTVMELFQTEKNYVGILHTIIKTFKEEIENPDQPGGPLLEPQHIKAIFGGIPPIFDVHVKIRDELGDIIQNWSEEALIGNVITKHIDGLIKSYPNFVNYFEQTKETIIKCDRSMPRFHAFLRVCQSKPECGRQTLKELLIRPVQRLPSVMLLLKDILKRTEENSADHTKLKEALAKLEEVMTHINEDRRKAEGHHAMFDIVNDIENCPANLLSAHRSFVTKIDGIELTSELSSRGDHITIFVFSDSLEMCKRRGRITSLKSPGAVHVAKTPQKAYRHLTLVPFSGVKRVVDICESTECRNSFALITKMMSEKEERLYAFSIEDEAVRKDAFLTSLSKAICDHLCRADYETLLTSVAPGVLSIDTNDIGNKTLTRAATKFGKRVSRAFSFNKTPRKLKRAMSSMTQIMSPFSRRDSRMFGPSASSTTPRGTNITSMRLASTNDLTLDENTLCESTYSDLVDQMSLGTPTMQRRRDTSAESDSPLGQLPRTPSVASNMSTLSTVSEMAYPPTMKRGFKYL
ncbi:hypothetical protein CAPTEDRAFT_176435 [Capitella teleta]|uniref:Protein ECT2 n=1 Tax=Capitella teleta TaxID=283909 RepID=R7V5J4_CAPTE|nr:hypothetical protein CAPTEDRAFT_176435 [Capitella teleta]|eukprot:ELU14128.1 hypothetical protein CAPTEDRAFT_176435 [Capitella teleta]